MRTPSRAAASWLLLAFAAIGGTRAAVRIDADMKSIPVKTAPMEYVDDSILIWYSCAHILWHLYVPSCCLSCMARVLSHACPQIRLTSVFYQPYLDSDMSSRWWDFGGDTIIRTDQYIRLASDRPSQSGWLFSRTPLSTTNWEVELEFSIQGSGNLHGDGFAMWLTKDRAKPGPVFGHKDEFEGLAIFFDTYKNNRPGTVFPYVMAMMGDGKTKYDQANDGKANEMGGCSVRLLEADENREAG